MVFRSLRPYFLLPLALELLQPVGCSQWWSGAVAGLELRGQELEAGLANVRATANAMARSASSPDPEPW